MSDLNRTVFHDRHVQAGAKMVDFAGWDMPVQYSGGIVLVTVLASMAHALNLNPV